MPSGSAKRTLTESLLTASLNASSKFLRIPSKVSSCVRARTRLFLFWSSKPFYSSFDYRLKKVDERIRPIFSFFKFPLIRGLLIESMFSRSSTCLTNTFVINGQWSQFDCIDFAFTGDTDVVKVYA